MAGRSAALMIIEDHFRENRHAHIYMTNHVIQLSKSLRHIDIAEAAGSYE